MKNVKTEVNGTELIIRVDLAKTFGPSASGKTIIIASTEGNQTIDGGGAAVMGLNIYKKR